MASMPEVSQDNLTVLRNVFADVIYSRSNGLHDLPNNERSAW